MSRFILSLIALVLCSQGASATCNVVNITSNITTNTTWGPTGTVVGDVFRVVNNIAIVPGVTLTIQRGVIVKFNQYLGLTVNGTLRANGKADSMIVITSIRDDSPCGDTNGDGNQTVPAPSDWAGITFSDASPDNSLLIWCDIRFAGYSSRGAVLLQSASDSLSNCTILRSYYGVDCQGTSAPVLSNTSIQASTMTPIALDLTANPVFDNLVFSSSDNAYDALGLRGGTLTSNATLPIRGVTVGSNPITNVTYVLFASLTINAGVGLTIDPGVVIKPVSSSVGFTVNGGLTMNGTAADTITVTSIHDDNFGQPRDTNNNGSGTAPARGNWERINFNQGSTGSLQYCRLKFGSNTVTQGMVEMTNTSVPISNSIMSDAGHGVTIHGTPQPSLSGVAINNMSSTPTLMSVSANPSFTNVTFLANAITALGIIGESVGADSHLYPRTVAGYANMTYYVTNGDLTIQSPSVLTVDPGVVVKFQYYYYGWGLTIDGALVADGTADSVIAFTSERDDQYGNPQDTNGDGSLTSPNVGDWKWIHYTATSNDALSQLDHCRIAYGSGPDYSDPGGDLWITSAAPTITNCVISKGRYGVRIDGNAAPVIDHCEISYCTYAPICMSVLADPSLTYNAFSTNGRNALALLSETLSQSATLRYRAGIGQPPFDTMAYMPIGTITIASGVTLSIEPKVIIKPSGLWGYPYYETYPVFAVNGVLQAAGGAGDERIVFTSIKDDSHGGDTNADGNATAPAAADWSGITFNDTSVDPSCLLRNCLFQFGGFWSSYPHKYGAVTTVNASPRILSCEFFQNKTAMAFQGTSQPSVDSTAVRNCTALPIVLSLLSNPSLAHIDLANNSYTALGIMGETVAQDARTRIRAVGSWSNIAYALGSDLTIGFGAKWTVDPGVVIKLRRYPDPLGGTITIDGALVADGKPDSLIVITSSADDAYGGDTYGDGALTHPQAGDWYYIRFTDVSNDAVTRMKYCRVRYGGYDNNPGVRLTNAGPNVENCVFTANTYGVRIEGNSSPLFSSCEMDSSTYEPIMMSLASSPTFTDVGFLRNGYTALGVISETIAQDLYWPIRALAGRQNMPYMISGLLTVGLGTTMTLQPGLIVKFRSQYAGIDVQRAFLAEGRAQAESLIVFTSYRDDFYGGDTDNSSTPPATNDWGNIQVEGTAIDDQVRFKNCVFRYGGCVDYYCGDYGALRITNASPGVDSCLFAYNRIGIYVEGASNPVIRDCSFSGNTSYGVNNAGNAFCVLAENTWWGAAGGPNDPSSTGDLCGLGANPGTGDKVSNNVDYVPWATGGLQTVLLGDVSLNGQILAFDASLVLQYIESLITLNPLQQEAADVSGLDGITEYDASLILQYTAGLISSFPAATRGAGANSLMAAGTEPGGGGGNFVVGLGEARRQGDEWEVPIRVTGDGPVYSLGLKLKGEAAGKLRKIMVPDGAGALSEMNVTGEFAQVGLAAMQPLPEGEAGLLRFAADDETYWEAPVLTWARVNEGRTEIDALPPILPVRSYLKLTSRNPVLTKVDLSLGLATREAGTASTILVLDVSGRLVRTLFQGTLPAGTHRLTWDLRDAQGHRVSAGLYFLEARVGPFRDGQRVVVVR